MIPGIDTGGGGFSNQSAASASAGPNTINVGGFNVPAYRNKEQTYIMIAAGVAVVGALVWSMSGRKKRKGK